MPKRSSEYRRRARDWLNTQKRDVPGHCSLGHRAAGLRTSGKTGILEVVGNAADVRGTGRAAGSRLYGATVLSQVFPVASAAGLLVLSNNVLAVGCS